MSNADDSVGRALEALLAGVAHDLRNPLNTFAMSTGLLKEDLERNDVDVQRALALVKRMERATQRMQSLIDDLVEASRIQANKIELLPRAEKVETAVREAVEAARPSISERGVTLVAGDVEPGLTAVADHARLVQALVKAVMFVSRSTADGGSIDVAAARADDGVALTVRSIGASAVPSSPASVKSPDEGRGGLALFIARGLAAAHGGSVEANVDDRTRLVIKLPSSKA